MRLLWSRTPVSELLADPATPPPLVRRLELVDEVRGYAEGLGLDVGGRYTAYVPWPGDFLVTTIVATAPGSVVPRTSWFPIVGDVPYRGYFDPERAAAEAGRLRGLGLDVCELRVRAYSTLGWFDDPLTGPMLRQPEPQLVETVFHELLHATLFVPGDAEFNEGVAAFVGQEARVRFYRDREGEAAGERERAAVARDRALRAEVLALRRGVERLYAEEPDGAARDAARRALEATVRAQLEEQVPAAALRLNDACLALSGTYHGDTPALAAALDALGGDLAAFIARAAEAAESDAPRAQLLGEAAVD